MPLFTQHKQDKSGNRAFTLVESLIAITIVLGTLTATYTAVTSAIRSSAHARDTITAFYLAQEAFEFVKNKRDTNSLEEGENWLAGLQDTEDTDNCGGNGCRLKVYDKKDGSPKQMEAGDKDIFQPIECGDIPDCLTRLHQYDGGTKEVYAPYSGGDWEPTAFRRRIQVSDATPHEASVTVTVYWKTGGSQQKVEFREQMTNWR